MFKTGSLIAHPSHGAGTLVDIQKAEVEGIERSYYCIELVNDGSTLMIPVKRAEETGLRPVMSNLDSIVEVLTGAPDELSDNYKKRQTDVAEQIYSGDPLQIAEALRDLRWLEHVKKLNAGDINLKQKAEQLLSSEVALQHGMSIDEANQYLNTILRENIQAREEATADAPPR